MKALLHSAAHVRHEKPETPSRKRKPLAQRHADMTDKSGGLFACWPWTGSIMQQSGYGQVRAPSKITGKTTMRHAHQIAWEVANGCQIPAGKLVRHTCHNPLCQNPAHLLLGNNAENRADDKAAGKVRQRLTREKVEAIAKLRDTGPTLSIAAIMGVSEKTVRNIWRGKSHTKITGFDRVTKKGGRKPKQAPAPVIILDEHRKPKARKPELVATL